MWLSSKNAPILVCMGLHTHVPIFSLSRGISVSDFGMKKTRLQCAMRKGRSLAEIPNPKRCRII